LDEDKLKSAGWDQQNGFGSAELHSLWRKAEQPCALEKRV